MRSIVLFLLLNLPLLVNSQTIIWSEDFTPYTDGTQNAVKWTTSANNCDLDGVPGVVGNNFWGVRTTLGDKEFCCEDIEGVTCCSSGSGGQGQSDNQWISQVISITGYSNVSISIDVRAEGNMECGSCGTGQDLFVASYQVNGGSWTNFLNVCGLQNGQSQIGCIYVGTGSTLRIRVLLGNQADDEEYYFDDVTVYDDDICSIILPIELVSFEGKYNSVSKLDELQWVTLSEINNDRFEVYSSINVIDWEYIGSVDGSGNSSTKQIYEFNHKSNSNLTYYRIKQVDYNGDFEYSNIISVSSSDEDNMIIGIKYYDTLGKELMYEPSNGVFIKVVEYRYKKDYIKIFKM